MSGGAVHLHVHSDYSLLDGACKVAALAQRAAEFGQPAIALTDHGVMSGVVELARACRQEGVKAIPGCEVYIVGDEALRAPGDVDHSHLTLVAATPAGYRNLARLVSLGCLGEEKSGEDALRLEQFAGHAEGIIVLTGCLRSELCRRLLGGHVDAARAHARDLMDLFGRENVYFEIQQNGLRAQDRANESIARLARESHRPLVATTDVHYLRREDYDHHAALLCAQSSSTLAQPRIRFETNEFYLRSTEELEQAFARWPNAVRSTLEIADRCDVELELARALIPPYPTPGEESEEEYLRALVLRGLEERYGAPASADAAERVSEELDVIARQRLAGLLLIVWDLVRYCKEVGIELGPGLAPASGSVVAYCLKIVESDPLSRGLAFERFLNLDGAAIPFVVVEVASRGRDLVLEHLSAMYGPESVASIASFGIMFARAAILQAAPVVGLDFAVAARLAKSVPDPHYGRYPSFEECLRPGTPLRLEVDADPTSKLVVDVARGFEGLLGGMAVHPTAIALSRGPLTDKVPLQRVSSARGRDRAGPVRPVTQFSESSVERSGVLVLHIAGTTELDVVQWTLDMVERATGRRPDLSRIALDDPATFEMLARGDSIGVHAFESDGIRSALKKVGPSEVSDLAALVALYKPGAIDLLPAFVERKIGGGISGYPDPRLRPILEATEGLFVYQEQVMQVARLLGGFTGARADDLRRAIGRRDRAALVALKAQFWAGCRASGTAIEIIQWLWTTFESSCDHTFSQGHAMWEALFAYRTAWLQVNYPTQYIAALLRSPQRSQRRTGALIGLAHRRGIPVALPEVNGSDVGTSVRGAEIALGLDVIPQVEEPVASAIVDERQRGGPFRSLGDFCVRMPRDVVGEHAIESLVRAGAFASTGVSRRGMVRALSATLASVDRNQPQLPTLEKNAAVDEYRQKQVIRLECEYFGAAVSVDLLRAATDILQRAADGSIEAAMRHCHAHDITIGGVLSDIINVTDSEDTMTFATLTDHTAYAKLVLYPDVVSEQSLEQGEIYLASGKTIRVGIQTVVIVDFIEAVPLVW